MQSDTAFLTGGSGIFCAISRTATAVLARAGIGRPTVIEQLCCEMAGRKVKEMDYPVIDPVGTGSNIKMLIRDSGNTIAGVGRMLGIADMSTMYKWLRGDALPGIDNMLALSIILNVSINDILVTK